MTLTIALLSALPFSPATRVRRSPIEYPVPVSETANVATESMVPSKNSMTDVAAAPASATTLTTVFLIGRNKLLVADIGRVFAMCFVDYIITPIFNLFQTYPRLRKEAEET